MYSVRAVSFATVITERGGRMVTAAMVEDQLKQLGVVIRPWMRPEIRELQKILVPNERIVHCISGRYAGGAAVLCATDMRILLIDKRPFFLTLEDIRYDMIVEVDFAHRLIDATLRVCMPSKILSFTSFKRPDIRTLTTYIQHRVLELRQQQLFNNAESDTSTPEPVPAFKSAVPAENNRIIESMVPARLPSITIPEAVNPYVRSSLVLKRRASRV